MYKFLKAALVGLLSFFFLMSPAFCKENKLPNKTKSMLINKLKDVSLVIYKDNQVQTYSEHGIVPLLLYLDNNNFKGTYAFDKTVGRAAAYLYVYGDAQYVYADVMSKPAIEILKQHNVKYEAKKVVAEIQNKDKTGLCPFEELTKNATSPAQSYGCFTKKYIRTPP